MSAFVEAPITTSEAQLKQEALERFVALVEAKGFVGWQPAAADLEVIITEVIASFGANAAVVASTVLNAAFVQFGVQFLKLAFNEGAAATATTKWTVVAEAGVRQIPAGTKIEIGGFGFEVATTTEVPAIATSVNVPVVAVEKGTEYNQLKEPVVLINPLAWVVPEITVIGETTSGENEETAEEYRVRLVEAIALQAPRPITAENFAAFLLQAPVAIAGVIVGRATSIDGYNPATTAFEATPTEGSAVLKEVTSFTGITKGSEITDAGEVIPAGATVESVNVAKSEITLTAAATATHAKEKMSAIGSFENGRYDCSFVTNKEGKALTNEQMTKLEEWLAGFREINFKALVRGPSVNKIYAKAKIHVLPEYEAAAVKAAVEAAIRKFINPATWGSPNTAPDGGQKWLNYIVKGGIGEHLYGTLRYNQLIGVIEAVPGVSYVFPGSAGLEIGRKAIAKAASDLVLVGPAPLPEVAELEVTTA